jgi:hypothetical protein
MLVTQRVVLTIVLGALFSFSSWATGPSTSKASYCANVKNNDYFKMLIMDSRNRMAFTNRGGLANGGVCWWHSRYQRAAVYLTTYRPDLPKPTRKQAKKIVRQIRKRRSVVIIPGYNNFAEFSGAWRYLIQKSLERWQILDGFVFQSWIAGLTGRSSVSPKNLKKKMDRLYKDVMVKGNISYQKLQLKGIVAHAWLVVDMKKRSNGYTLKIIDSNYKSVRTYNYTYGDTNFVYAGYTPFVPYLGKKWELRRMRRSGKRYCR